MNNKNNTTGKRITSLRADNDMTQLSLATKLSELSKRFQPLTVSTISSWESGRRQPSAEMFIALSKLFQVSIEYLKGLNNDPSSHDIDSYDPVSVASYRPSPDIVVKHHELQEFDSKPLFVSFKNHAHLDQWAIYNKNKKCLILRDGLLKEDDESINKIYAMEPYYSYFISENGKAALSMNRLLSVTTSVWVEMISSDSHVCNVYNGWYKHNENHSCLISGIGMVLPYEGLNVSYHAYMK